MKGQTEVVHAYLPWAYVPEARHRLEIYRKLAQVTALGEVAGIEAELRDRFGPLPEAVKLLMQVVELRVLAGMKGVAEVSVEEGRLKLRRLGEYLQVQGRFPRLTRKGAGARLREIRNLVRALVDAK